MCFSLSLLTLGVFYVLVAWPWAIVNAVFARKKSYVGVELQKEKIRASKDIKFLVHWGVFLHTLLIGIGALVLGAGLANLQLGNEVFNSDFAEETRRSIFWMTFWAALLVFLLVRLLARYPADYFLSKLKVGLKIVLAIGIAGGLITSQVVGRDGSIVGACSLEGTLNTALGAAYPIATDTGSGTGFAVNGSGQILTAYHVVEGANRIYLSLTTGEVEVSVIRVAPEYDLALLQSSQPTPVFMALDTDYSIPEKVYAVGWPGNTFDAGGASVTSGIISRVLTNKDLELSGETPPLLEVIQTDAAINPGNSGGALVGNCGAVGVVTWMSDSNQLGDYGFASEQGISYAVSSKTVKQALGL